MSIQLYAESVRQTPPFNAKETGPLQGYVKSAQICGCVVKCPKPVSNSHPQKSCSNSMLKMAIKVAFIATVVIGAIILASRTAMNTPAPVTILKPFTGSIDEQTSFVAHGDDRICMQWAKDLTEMKSLLDATEKSLSKNHEVAGSDFVFSANKQISVLSNNFYTLKKITCPYNNKSELEIYEKNIEKLYSSISKLWLSLEPAYSSAALETQKKSEPA